MHLYLNLATHLWPITQKYSEYSALITELDVKSYRMRTHLGTRFQLISLLPVLTPYIVVYCRPLCIPASIKPTVRGYVPVYDCLMSLSVSLILEILGRNSVGYAKRSLSPLNQA